MSLSAQTHVGPYQIVEPIGAGGMGEVYRARDMRLARDVAVKVSSERFSERFEREARTIASLNHPNICTLYDVGANYLVMELVEGPTLAGRIQQGPVPLDEAVHIAKQIAAALEAAHQKGIVHRDLKPGNVKIKLDGTVKVLDFGLAKAGGTPTVGDAGNNPDHSPTITLGDTKAGVILGTAAYMAPEQAKGKPVDQRADIWAFGVVLYEMLTGRRLFRGETTTEILASVIKEEPEWDLIPAQAAYLLRLCLRKDPAQRLHDIADARLLLEGTGAQPRPPRKRRRLWLGAAAGLLVCVAALLTFARFRQATPAGEPVRFTIPLPPKAIFTPGNTFNVSPDGRKVVFNATGPEGGRLWVRMLDSAEAHPLLEAGSVFTATAFWSPDSRSVAYGAQKKLKRIEIAGGPAQTICDVPGYLAGGSWNRDGAIIFGTPGGIMRVAAAGGVASPLTVADSSRGEIAHIDPLFLPDQKHFIYFISQSENSGIYVGSLDARAEAQTRKRLISTRFAAAYVPSPVPARGQLLFLREGTLMAEPFDARRLELTDDAVPVVERVGSTATIGRGFFSASDNGVLMYTVGVRQNFQLTFFDRQGRITGMAGEPGRYGVVALSPDGARAAATLTDPETNNEDIWLIDSARGQSTRFTFDPARDIQPVWSPDGAYVAFASNRGAEWGIYRKAANGAASEELLAKTATIPTLTQWTEDERFIVYFTSGGETGQDLWILPLNGDRKPFPFLRAPFNQLGARVSPDGRWIAYRSDESGKNELYVQAFDPKPEAGNAAAAGKWMVSKGSDGMARWRSDGKELYYITADGSIMAVDVTTSPVFYSGTPRLLFKLPQSFLRDPTGTPGARADTRDGRRFLVAMPIADDAPPELNVVLNWQAGVRR